MTGPDIWCVSGKSLIGTTHSVAVDHPETLALARAVDAIAGAEFGAGRLLDMHPDESPHKWCGIPLDGVRCYHSVLLTQAKLDTLIIALGEAALQVEAIGLTSEEVAALAARL